MSEENTAPEVGTPEHDAAMIKLAEDRMGAPVDSEDEKDTEEVTTHTKPEGVPDKYWNAETGVVDYAGINKETEYWRNKANGKETEEPDKEENKEGSDDEEDKAKETLESKGLDMNTFSEEYAETGELSQESYDKLEAAGIPKEMVDAYIEGREAIASNQRATVLKDVGGEEGYEAMTEWMKANLSTEDLENFNEQVGSSNLSTAKNAIDVMYGKYQEANGTSGDMISGDSPSQNYSGFNSRTEMSAAINDPRYGKDSHYAKEVEAKLAKTSDDVFRQ